MTNLTPDDFLFYLDEQGGSLVDHQLPGTPKQRIKTLKAVQENPDFTVIPGHLTPCRCSVVSLSETGRHKITEILKKENKIKEEIQKAFEKGGHMQMSFPEIMRSIRAKTHYGKKHIELILDEMVQEGALSVDTSSEDSIYSV